MSSKNAGWLHVVAFTLLVVGGLNWGLIGLLNFNLVSALFGMGAMAQLVYVLVGVSAVYLVLTHKDDCKTCEMMMKTTSKKSKGKRR
jgi:hypothetical protein